MGWRSSEPSKLANEEIGVKLTQTLEAPDFSRGIAHHIKRMKL